MKILPNEASGLQRRKAALKTIRRFPQLINAFIHYKERHGEQAVRSSVRKVKMSEAVYLENFGNLVELLDRKSNFYHIGGRTYREALKRVHFLKDVIESKGGHKFFYVKGQPLQRETDLHILYRLTWFAPRSDVSREVNDGRGPADFKISEGSKDKTLVEFKLAGNSQLEKNLAHQTKIYEKASDASQSIKVIVFFTAAEQGHVLAILRRLKMDSREDVVLIDARADNKPPGSKAA